MWCSTWCDVTYDVTCDVTKNSFSCYPISYVLCIHQLLFFNRNQIFCQCNNYVWLIIRRSGDKLFAQHSYRRQSFPLFGSGEIIQFRHETQYLDFRFASRRERERGLSKLGSNFRGGLNLKHKYVLVAKVRKGGLRAWWWLFLVHFHLAPFFFAPTLRSGKRGWCREIGMGLGH